MKEYHQIEDLPTVLKNELEGNASFFDNFDGKSLDEQQRIACVLNDCDLEIIAGAGTGKTHTLLAKAAYLIEKKNVAADDILFLSFSKSCVEELIERLNYDIPTSTIHAFGLSLIDEYREKEVFDGWGFKKIFDEYLETASDKQISDIQDYCLDNLKSEDMIKYIELDTDIEKFNHLISKSRISSRIRSFIDLFKGKGYGASDFKKIKAKCKHEFETRDGNYYTDENYLRNMSFIQLVEPVYRFYESYLHRNHLIDFNDMINKAIELIENEGIYNDFKYIFVDEYQDMSYKNFRFIKTLKQACNARLVVVGDDWQSIYGFRDSDISLFNDFCDYFPDANRVFIEKTYRNPQELIDIAGNFIMKNDSQFKKSLKSDTSIENPVKIVYDDDPDSIYNLINNLSKDSERVFILGRHNGDIDDFIFGTDLVKKSKKEYKQITNDYGTINNVEYRTVHKAKGLEADYVVLINVFNQQVGFPNKLYPPYFMNLMHDWDYDKKLEEERRLFYVAITRAKKGVYIFTKDYKQSEYLDELIDENDLELIYGDDFNQYEEFNRVKEESAVSSDVKSNLTDSSNLGIVDSDIKSELIDKNDFDYSKGIEIKANQKDHGNKLMKSKEYDEAEDFYKKLITNMYYLNDYYPFRKLVEVYIKKKEHGNVINTIKEFFKSERYCSGSQLLWFKFKYRKSYRKTEHSFSEFDECLAYFNEHGLKNKYKQNEPVPIAARIKTGRRKVKIIPQEDYDKKMEYEELRLKHKYADIYESPEKALYYYEQLWNRPEFSKNIPSYERLCSLYYDTQQYEKVIETAEEYFNSNANKTNASISRFDDLIAKASKKLGETPKTHKLSVDTNNSSSRNQVNTSNMSNDEKLFKFADMYEKGLLTRDEFDRKKKELLFNDNPSKPDVLTKVNDNSSEQVMSTKINENPLEIPFITIAGTNLTKLLKRNVGEVIIVQYYSDSVKLEIVDIHNQSHVYNESNSDKLKFTVIRENFEILKSLIEGELITFKTKGRSQEVVLKKVTEDIRKKLNRFIKDLEKTKSTSKSCNNLNISDAEFNSWISKDKWDVEPYASFQTAVNDIIRSEDNEDTIYEEEILSEEDLSLKLNTFIADLKKTKSITKSCNNLNISDVEFNSWISKDKWDVEPYASFQSAVNSILRSEDNEDIVLETEISSTDDLSLKLDNVIKDLEKTKNLNKTRNNLNISAKEFNSWITKDKWNVEPYASFLTNVERIILEDKERHQFPHAIKNKHKKRSKNQKNPKEKVMEKVFTDFVNRYVSHLESTPKSYLNDEHLKLIDLATECIENNDLYVAMEYYDEILNQYPNFEVLNKKGFLLIQLDEFEMAINCFDKSLEYQMKNNFYAHAGKALAISNLLRLYECNPDQIEWDNKFESMKNHCNVACLIDYEGYIYKAKVLNVLGHYNNAIDVIDEMLDDEMLENKLYYSALLEKSFSFRKLGKYYQAIECYDELLKVDENNVNILLNKAEILFILKMYKDSINVFNLVLELDQNNIDALMYLGVIYQNFNNFDEALLNFDRILEIDDSFYNALIYKAQLLVDLHRYDEAIFCFDKCGDKLSADYQKLFKFAKEEAQQNNQTDYYAVIKTDFANFKYVYTYVDNGLRKIYGEDLEDLKIKVLAKSRLWMNLLNENLLDIPVSNEVSEFAKKFIQNYYKGELSEYDGLISLILNNEFLEKLDQNNLDLNELINSKKGIERDIIRDLVYTMNQKLNFVHDTNFTGYFGVITQNKSDGTRWSYLDLVRDEYVNTRVIYAKTLDELEEKVKSENSLWYIFDEVLAKESQKRDNVNSSKNESTVKFSQNNLKNVITVGSNNFNTLIKSDIGDEIIAQIVNRSYKFIKLQIVDIQNRKIVENFPRNVIKISEENFNFIENLRPGELITIKSKGRRGKVILKLYDDEKSTKDIEIKSFKKQIEDDSTNYKESPVDKHVNETSKSTVKYILDISLPDKYELDLDNLFGFDSTLSDEDNIKRKFILKDNGNYLTKEKLYDDAIEYYECLKNNSYFENDWYPYRQLVMIFEKKGKHEENIENIKQLFFSGIYCNGYQYTWFIHKLNNALSYVEIEESEIGTWLDYYNEHGAKNENRLDTPIFIADRIVKHDNKIRVYSKQMIYNKYQKLSEFKEKVRFSEQIGDYESALEAIRLYYQEYYSKIAHKDTMWFRRKLKSVNKELGTNYDYTDFI